MTVIRLAGGLGNQVFQVAAALYITNNHYSKKIIIDDNALEKYDVKRKNELLNFFDFTILEIEVEFKNISTTKLRLPKLLPLNIPKYPLISDNNFQTMLNNPNKYFMLLDGYFQECLTQNNFDSEIKLLSKIFIKKNSELQNGCVIHIRGGDFVKLGWNSVTPNEYYVKSIEIMKNEYKQDKFFIVTDDKKYSQIILDELDINYEFIGNSMQEDFYLIGSFKYRILSSSTFAFWASALGNNEDSIVIAPKYWIPNHERKIYLPNEMRIEF